MHRLTTKLLAAVAVAILAVSGLSADTSRMTVSVVEKPKGAAYAFAYSRGKQVIMRKYIYRDVRVFEVVREGLVLATVQTGEKENRCSVSKTPEGIEVVLLGKGKTLAFNRIEIRKGEKTLEAYYFDEKLNLTPVSSEEFKLLNEPKDVESTN